MVLLVVFRYNVDHALHFSHIVAHADGNAQFALCGHIGIAVELKQIVVHRAAPLLQRIMVAGNTVAQLLQRKPHALKRGALAGLTQVQQLGAVEYLVHQPADFIGQKPFQILLHLQGVHLRRYRHAALPAAALALYGDEGADCDDLLRRQRGDIGLRGQQGEKQCKD